MKLASKKSSYRNGIFSLPIGFNNNRSYLRDETAGLSWFTPKTIMRHAFDSMISFLTFTSKAMRIPSPGTVNECPAMENKEKGDSSDRKNP